MKFVCYLRGRESARVEYAFVEAENMDGVPAALAAHDWAKPYTLICAEDAAGLPPSMLPEYRAARVAAIMGQKPTDPYLVFKEAIKAGKVIECTEYPDGAGPWLEITSPAWTAPAACYRIRPEPAKAPEPAMQFTTLTIKGDPAEAQWLESQSLRRPSDGPEMAIPEPQFPYNHVSEPSTALPACAGLGVVWQDQCWARR